MELAFGRRATGLGNDEACVGQSGREPPRCPWARQRRGARGAPQRRFEWTAILT